MDATGNLLDYQQFCIKHKLNPSQSDFIKLQHSLLHGFIFLTKNCLSETLFPGRQNKNSILHNFDDKSIDKLRSIYLTFPMPPKMKETHSKIMNIYPSKELSRLCFNISDNLCTFCENDIETMDYIFFSW